MNVRRLLMDTFGPDDIFPARRFLYFVPLPVLAAAYLRLRKAAV